MIIEEVNVFRCGNMMKGAKAELHLKGGMELETWFKEAFEVEN